MQPERDSHSPRRASLETTRPARLDLAIDAGPVAAWQPLIDAMLDAVWLVDPHDLRILAVNRAAGTLAGVPPRQLVGRPVAELCASPEDACFWDEVAAGIAETVESETLLWRADGPVPVTRRVSRIDDGDRDAVACWVVCLHDRRDQVRAVGQLEDTAADLQATLESTHDGILVTDLSGRIRHFNGRFLALWGLPTQLATRRDDDAVLDRMRRAVVDPPGYMRRLAVLDDQSEAEAIDAVRLLSGKVIERITRPQRSRGLVVGRVVSFRDITETTDAQARIQTLAYTDPLTGLPNRRLLADRVEQSLALARRDGSGLALMYVNLDRLGEVSRTAGRMSGDRVLIEVAARLRAGVREVDTVARMGSDEFAVLVQQSDEAGARIAASRLVEALRPLVAEGREGCAITASIGIARCPHDGTTFDALLHGAFAAMRAVKADGGDGTRFATPFVPGLAEPTDGAE